MLSHFLLLIKIYTCIFMGLGSVTRSADLMFLTIRLYLLRKGSRRIFDVGLVKTNRVPLQLTFTPILRCLNEKGADVVAFVALVVI